VRVTKKKWRTQEVRQRGKRIRLLLLDVDGVLTDGRIVYGNGGLEVLAFHVRDGLAIKIAQASGITVGLVSGRKSEALLRRAEELNLEEVHTGVEDKIAVYRQILMRYRFDDAERPSPISAGGFSHYGRRCSVRGPKRCAPGNVPSRREGGGSGDGGMASQIPGSMESGMGGFSE
jgi:hypothetical protein